MTTKIGLFKCAILLNFVAVYGFGVISIKNMNEEQLMTKLAKILDESAYNGVENQNHIAVRTSRKDLHDAHKKFERKRLIKTYLPHGQAVNFETDGEAMYKTLVRIHKKAPIFVKDNDMYKIKFNSVLRSGEPIDSVEVKKTKRHKKLDKKKIAATVAKLWEKMKTLKYKYRERKPKDDGKAQLRTIKDLFNKTKIIAGFKRLWKIFKKSLPTIKKAKKKFKPKRFKFINKEGKEHLRSGRSGEEHDPLAPGKIPFNIELHEETTQKASQWQPSYSFWNYWTYDKSLYQDKCKGSLIKVGDRCIGSPPH